MFAKTKCSGRLPDSADLCFSVLSQITESQADTLEYEVAEALQDLITKNAKKNEVDDISMEFPISRTKDVEQNQGLKVAQTSLRSHAAYSCH